MIKEKIIDELYNDWNWVINNFLDEFREIVYRKLGQKTKVELEAELKELRIAQEESEAWV